MYHEFYVQMEEYLGDEKIRESTYEEIIARFDIPTLERREIEARSSRIYHLFKYLIEHTKDRKRTLDEIRKLIEKQNLSEKSVEIIQAFINKQFS